MKQADFCYAEYLLQSFLLSYQAPEPWRTQGTLTFHSASSCGYNKLVKPWQFFTTVYNVLHYNKTQISSISLYYWDNALVKTC